MSLDSDVSGVARESDCVRGDGVSDRGIGDGVDKVGGDEGYRDSCCDVRLSDNERDESNYQEKVREARMYFRSHCRSDARKIVKEIVGAGYLSRLMEEEPDLHNLYRMGGL